MLDALHSCDEITLAWSIVFSLLLLPCCKFCVLGAHEIYLGQLVAQLLPAWCALQWLLNSPFSLQAGTLCLQGTWLGQCCPHLLFCIQSSSSFMKKPEDVMMQDLSSLSGVLRQIDLSFYSVVPLIHALVPCQKLVSKSTLALTSLDCGLQNSSNLSHMVSKYNSSLGKLQDTYWSIPKSPLQAITFLHFLLFLGGPRAHIQEYFSHFNLHFWK